MRSSAFFSILERRARLCREVAGGPQLCLRLDMAPAPKRSMFLPLGGIDGGLGVPFGNDNVLIIAYKNTGNHYRSFSIVD
jgi:hypothetical protein